MSIPSILTTAPKGTRDDDSHSTNEKTEAQRGKVTQPV